MKSPITKNPYDMSIPLQIQIKAGDQEEFSRLCPGFGREEDSYHPHDKACIQCHLSLVCMVIHEQLYGKKKHEEIKVELGTPFYSEVQISDATVTELLDDLKYTINKRYEEGNSVTEQRLIEFLPNLCQERFNSPDPNLPGLVIERLKWNKELWNKVKK